MDIYVIAMQCPKCGHRFRFSGCGDSPENVWEAYCPDCMAICRNHACGKWEKTEEVNNE